MKTVKRKKKTTSSRLLDEFPNKLKAFVGRVNSRYWPFLNYKTRYRSGRVSAIICCSSGYASLVLRRVQDVLSVWANCPSSCVVQEARLSTRNA